MTDLDSRRMFDLILIDLIQCNSLVPLLVGSACLCVSILVLMLCLTTLYTNL